MTSGGARTRSGPAPDPNALRRDRKADGEWTILPAEGRKGDAPVWPLEPWCSDREAALWADLWVRPQAIMWENAGQEPQVAMYVRRFAEAEAPGANYSLSNHVKQLGDYLGLTLPSMTSMRWKIAEDETAARREAAPAPRSSSRDRLKVVEATS